MVIEVDGGQHYSAEGKERDGMRDHYMARAGIAVLRFSDREVLNNLDAVLEQIWRQLSFIKSPLTPLCQRGGEKRNFPKVEERRKHFPKRGNRGKILTKGCIG